MVMFRCPDCGMNPAGEVVVYEVGTPGRSLARLSCENKDCHFLLFCDAEKLEEQKGILMLFGDHNKEIKEQVRLFIEETDDEESLDDCWNIAPCITLGYSEWCPPCEVRRWLGDKQS